MSFSNTALVGFFEEHGLGMKTTEGGKVFPSTMRSSDVVRVLGSECEKERVLIRYDHPVKSLKLSDGYFKVMGKALFEGSSLVISTGGASYPGTGSTGDGYRLAASFGHTITETAPALTPVIVRENPFGDLAGVSFAGTQFSLWREGKKRGSYRGDLLFTHEGLSGPGILDASRDIREGDIIAISFVKSRSRDEFSRDLLRRLDLHPISGVKKVLSTYGLPERLVVKILAISGVPAETTGAHLTKEKRNEITGNLTGFPVRVSRLGGYDVAMVTRGGVSLTEVNQKTMESRLVPGLYFAGEVLDIDGDTGGYNIQAAFSTGFIAAKSILVKSRRIS
jgi:predicted Rossmann fold flavoprotein